VGIIENVKAVVDLSQEVGKIELYKQAVELMGQVTNARLYMRLDIAGRWGSFVGTIVLQIFSLWVFRSHVSPSRPQFSGRKGDTGGG
jgi:hypothetical protein